MGGRAVVAFSRHRWSLRILQTMPKPEAQMAGTDMDSVAAILAVLNLDSEKPRTGVRLFHPDLDG